MGQLKPGATLIYERENGTVYSRELGSDPSTRQVVGWNYTATDPIFDPRTSGQQDLDDHKEWVEIRLAGKHNPTLQKAIDNVKLVYKIVKDDSDE